MSAPAGAGAGVQTFCDCTGAMPVAEGAEDVEDAEDAEDAATLVKLGVGHAQGWFLARPADPDVVLPVLAAVAAPVVVLP